MDEWEHGGLSGCYLGAHLGADLQARDKDKEEEKSCPALPCPVEATKLSRAAAPRAVFAQGLTDRSWGCSTRWDVL